MTPNGIATRIVGSSETRTMNQAWRKNSCQEKLRRTMSSTAPVTESQARSTSSPPVTMPVRARSERSAYVARAVVATLLIGRPFPGTEVIDNACFQFGAPANVAPAQGEGRDLLDEQRAAPPWVTRDGQAASQTIGSVRNVGMDRRVIDRQYL